MDLTLIISSLKTGLGALSSIQSNDVLRERLILINEQIKVIQEAHESSQKELAELKAKNLELEKEVASYREKDNFVQHFGAAFRKDASGHYIRAVYCPNCIKQVGAGSLEFPYHCSSCGWYSDFNVSALHHIMSSLP